MSSEQHHDMSKMQMNTKCVHFGYNPSEHHHAANPPIYLSSTFEFDTAEACADAFCGKPQPGQCNIYSRLTNPTTNILELRLAAIESAEAAVATASGIGAIASTFWTFLKAGSVLIASNRVYGCTYALLAHQLTRFGVNVQFVDMTDLKAVAELLNKFETVDMVYTESIQNPTNDVVDLEEISKLAHAKKARFVVDNTFATPISCNPLKFGADLVIHSATKYLIGGIFTAGAVMGSADDICKIRFIGIKDCTGAVIDAALSFAMIQGIETLHLRVKCMSDNARQLAEFLEKHPKVEKVVATALPSHPQKDLVAKYLSIPNGLFSVYVKGGIKECQAMMNKFQLAYRAVSLGKTHTLVNHPASMTHSTYTQQEREKYGIADNLVRISVGCEDAIDIINDFKQALE
uniref:Methionine gamma-lyase n=1 Tax=Trepomonas sp. PC1 TaxID=1076344 RepID=A0A146K7M1_9EUKA|eukprot:JAP91596.1 Methionine gamma-lyase [Trepomonas sp. PC1]